MENGLLNKKAINKEHLIKQLEADSSLRIKVEQGNDHEVLIKVKTAIKKDGKPIKVKLTFMEVAENALYLSEFKVRKEKKLKLNGKEYQLLVAEVYRWFKDELFQLNPTPNAEIVEITDNHASLIDGCYRSSWASICYHVKQAALELLFEGTKYSNHPNEGLVVESHYFYNQALYQKGSLSECRRWPEYLRDEQGNHYFKREDWDGESPLQLFWGRPDGTNFQWELYRKPIFLDFKELLLVMNQDPETTVIEMGREDNKTYRKIERFSPRLLHSSERTPSFKPGDIVTKTEFFSKDLEHYCMTCTVVGQLEHGFYTLISGAHSLEDKKDSLENLDWACFTELTPGEVLQRHPLDEEVGLWESEDFIR